MNDNVSNDSDSTNDTDVYDHMNDLLNAAYTERAQLLAFFTTWHPCVLSYNDPNARDYAVLYVTTFVGQMSWHIAPRDMHLFNHVAIVSADDPRAVWDKHDTEEKYRRFAEVMNTVLGIRELVGDTIKNLDDSELENLTISLITNSKNGDDSNDSNDEMADDKE